MAREVIQRVTDDLDGSPDAATIQFSLDGYAYEIDLGPRNEARFRDVLAPFVERAAKVRHDRRPGRGGQRSTASRDGDKERAQLVRQWALDNGVQLAARGRIAVGVLDAYDGENVAALHEAVGLEYEPEIDAEVEARPKRSRGKAAEVMFSES
jgi:nucleoid-associated protein Lsr2